MSMASLVSAALPTCGSTPFLLYQQASGHRAPLEGWGLVAFPWRFKLLAGRHDHALLRSTRARTSAG